MASQLQQTFKDAYQYFNNQDWTKLEPLLDDNVTMKQIDDPVLYHQKKTDVMNYFRGTGSKDKANFTPTSSDYRTVGNMGLVQGSADWKGTSTKKAVSIAYAFAFKNVNGSWLAVNLWGAYAS